MTSDDNKGHSNHNPTQGTASSHPSKFKTQLRADAQEFKPTFGITNTNAIPTTGIYYHGIIHNYGHIIDYDGYQMGNNFYSKSLGKKQNNELLRTVTSLNPNAQEFIPRGWVGHNNEIIPPKMENSNLTSPILNEPCIQQENLENTKQDNSFKKTDVETASGDKLDSNLLISSGTEKLRNKLDHTEPEESQPSSKIDLDLEDSAAQKIDRTDATQVSSNKSSIQDASQYSAPFTFKEKLLARVNGNGSTNSASNATNASTVNIEKKSNIDPKKNITNDKELDDKDNASDIKKVNDINNTEVKESVNFKNESLNQNKTTKKSESIETHSERKKQVDSVGPVSWAQRLKNSTNNTQILKNNGEAASLSSNSNEKQINTSKKGDKHDIAKDLGSAITNRGKIDISQRDKLEITEKIVDSSKKSQYKQISSESENSSKNIEATYVTESEDREKVKKLDVSKHELENSVETQPSSIQDLVNNSNESINSLENQTHDHSAKTIYVAMEMEKPDLISTTQSGKIPIFILLALREISKNYKNLDMGFSPPELCKRNLSSKEIDRDRGRTGWSGNTTHTGKHYHRDNGNYGPGTRRERYQGHGGNLNSQGGKRPNENPSNNSQDSTLDWSRDERKVFRLESSAESWVVKQKEQKAKGSQHETQLRQYRAILNKLTIEKFDKLYEQILSVGIRNEEDMIGLLKLVFDKATTQHHFIPMYVELCDKLRDHLKDVTTIETRRILVDLCQELFVENLSDMVLPEHIQNNEEDSFEWQLKYKNKMKGNMIFMASLVRKKVIASTVVLMCMEELLQFHLPHHLEALCVFLHHVGPFLDSERWKHYDDFNALFRQFEEFSTNSDIPIRIRFLINDVIDSRKNNWKSKNIKEGPMMLDDLKLKINAERGELAGNNVRSNNSVFRSQGSNLHKGSSEKNDAFEYDVKSVNTSYTWQRQGISYSVLKDTSETTNFKIKNGCDSNSPNNSESGRDEYQSVDNETLNDENEYFLPDHIKDSIGGLMDSYVASYDLDEFFGHLNDLEIPSEHFAGVYKNIFIRIAEYKTKQRSALLKALILFALKNGEYMNGESAKSGILMVLQPSILDDILIDVPQFKDIVLVEFVRDAISEYDSEGQVFDSDFIEQVKSLLG